MKLLFREISKPSAPPPGAGELYIHPGSPELQHRRDLASLVVQQGLACLRQGTGPIETIVVRADPTLDDLLAAAFAGELLAGRPLPKAAEAFARYAALVREGLTPGAVSLEVSMQGIFKAIRVAAGNDFDVAGGRPTVCRRLGADGSPDSAGGGQWTRPICHVAVRRGKRIRSRTGISRQGPCRFPAGRAARRAMDRRYSKRAAARASAVGARAEELALCELEP